jgi:hypothetical protein
MDATPFEQDVVAVATKFTLVPTVLPFAGLDTVTPANADVAARKSTKIAVEI